MYLQICKEKIRESVTKHTNDCKYKTEDINYMSSKTKHI